jgi:hypothetical protein
MRSEDRMLGQILPGKDSGDREMGTGQLGQEIRDRIAGDDGWGKQAGQKREDKMART